MLFIPIPRCNMNTTLILYSLSLNQFHRVFYDATSEYKFRIRIQINWQFINTIFELKLNAGWVCIELIMIIILIHDFQQLYKPFNLLFHSRHCIEVFVSLFNKLCFGRLCIKMECIRRTLIDA